MPELPRSSKYRATPDAPLSDGERERIVARLNAAYEGGQVDADAYPRLLDTAFAARTLGEIAPVVEVVPGEVTYDVPAVVQAGTQPPGELAQAKSPSTGLVLGVAGAVVGAVLLLVLVIGVLGFLPF
ncbi:DUF1707 domain-containing protein [Propioniciclava coleopterorum]|uniref:DUF1707 domain-containing protein n=1 Tax=Propioniciclava coleopterorum TaxID=2714937 RepID=A0A6G7Y3Y8_9ACTN|nr:DUF1707 domain-containing protein [Propioniciclava coleopterorum]QIK71419.1 DUF1707 domain-containing protein [Propioniciclava coleopterorum]